jgi:hypothetical protein
MQAGIASRHRAYGCGEYDGRPLAHPILPFRVWPEAGD